MNVNRQGVLLETEADSTATRTSVVQRNTGGYAGLLIEVTTANKAGTTATYTPSLVAVMPSGEEVTVWTASSALTGNGTASYQLRPGASGGDATEKASVSAPIEWKFVLTAASADGSNNMDTSASFQYLG